MLGRNFDITNGRAACEACSATWNLCTNSAFAHLSKLQSQSHFTTDSQSVCLGVEPQIFIF
jgi:hypothetical protein